MRATRVHLARTPIFTAKSMITKEELFVAGKVSRTHGVTGEWVCIGNTDVLDECPYIVLNMDGLFVPFFIASRRYQSDTAWLMQVEGVDNEQKAKNIVGKDVYLPLAWQEKAEQVSYAYFIGFDAFNEETCIGNIVDVNDQTENVLFCIETKNGVVMIPAVEAFIIDIDHKNKRIYFDLPIGLLTINE